MFVRVELVLFGGILFGTCLPASTGFSLSLNPRHRHSTPGKPVTFTCTADQAVAACEFLVRFKDTDLSVVNPAQAPSGSWKSAGDQSANVIPVGAARQPEVGPGSQDGGGAGGIDPRRRPSGATVMRSAAELAQGGQQTATEAHDAAEIAVASQGQFYIESTSTSQLAKSRSASVPETTGNWSYARRVDRARDGPALLFTTARPKRSAQQRGMQSDQPPPVDRWVWGNHRSLKVFGANDKVRGAATPLSLKISPYPSDDAQVGRRVHHKKRVYPAPKQPFVAATPPSMEVRGLSSRLADDGYQWQGRAEEKGCSLTLPMVQEGRHVVGCRARKEQGGWEYVAASMDVNRFKPMGMTAINPPVTARGANVTVACRSATTMTSCYVNRPQARLTNVRKECSGSVGAVSGPVWCAGVQGRAHKEAVAVFVRVRTQPKRVEIALPKTRFKEGEFFTATCAVGALQEPAPNISWLLGDELLRGDSDDDIPDSRWMWPWEGREWRQSLYMTLSLDDDNLPLTCQVEHPDLPAPLSRSVTLRVKQDSDDGTANCGIIITERVMGGTKAVNVPWIAAIYRRVRSGVVEHVCGGTLVSRRLVVSSAQCFWDATYTRIADPSLFRVAVGRTSRDWDPSDARVQTPGIMRVAAPKHFIGRSSHFAYDIAVVVLDSPVTLSDNVVPACVDLAGQLPDLQPGDRGTVAGWGVTESGVTSPALRSLEMPYVDLEDCTSAVDADLHRFITYDKFCAGFRDQRKSVCPGDSGGGLVFEDPVSGRHYLRGVASVAFAPIGNDENCFADLYSGFTLVSEYASWIFKQAPPPVTA